MKVLLIKPYLPASEIVPPLGLGYLASTIRDKHHVEIIDGIKEKLTLIRFKKRITNGDYDVIGIQCYTFDKEIVKEMIKIIRNSGLDAAVIVGGVHPSSEPDCVFDYLKSDYGFKGEAEIGFPMLIDYLNGEKIKLREIPNLIWKNKGNITVNEIRYVENLDGLNPSWDLIRPDTYPLAPHGAFFKRKPIAPIFATRGCPFRCTFCAGFLISGRKIRYRSVKNFVDEIEMLHKEYGINEIHIEDDNFTLNKRFVEGFCSELTKRKIDITWALPNGVRLDTLDEKLIDMMKGSGLYCISVGIESGSDRILEDMRKQLTTRQIKEKILMIDKVGLDIIGFFILGYPTETTEDINATIDFACSLPLKRASFMAFKPFPNTEITKRIKGFTADKSTNFVLNKVIYSPKNMTKRKLRQLRHKALVKFYFRPRIIYSLLKELKNIQHIRYVFGRAFKWLVY